MEKETIFGGDSPWLPERRPRLDPRKGWFFLVHVPFLCRSCLFCASAWLRKTESGSTRLSTWVWFLGVMLLIAIGAGIGVGWYFTHNKPAAAPVAIGGSADEGFSASTSNTAIAVSTKATRVTAAPEPTNTNNNNGKRNGDEVLIPMVRAMPTVPAAHRRLFVDRKPRFIS